MEKNGIGREFYVTNIIFYETVCGVEEIRHGRLIHGKKYKT